MLFYYLRYVDCKFWYDYIKFDIQCVMWMFCICVHVDIIDLKLKPQISLNIDFGMFSGNRGMLANDWNIIAVISISCKGDSIKVRSKCESFLRGEYKRFSWSGTFDFLIWGKYDTKIRISTFKLKKMEIMARLPLSNMHSVLCSWNAWHRFGKKIID